MKIFTEFLKDDPEEFKEEFIKDIKTTNYRRVKNFSYLLVFISFLMYIIAVIDQDIQIIRNINLTFFLVTLIMFIILTLLIKFNFKKDFIKKAYIYFFIFDVLIWSTILVSLVPDRYELFSTYSIVILAISAIVYLKWYISLFIYFSSLFIVSMYFLSRVNQHLLPKISTLFFLILISWIVSRLLYNKQRSNFVAQNKLEQQKANMKKEVLKKSRQLKNYENEKIEEMIHSISKLLELYDPYTRGHSESVASLSQDIAKKMDLSNKSIKDTFWAGMVHDIGKVLIPKEILNKKGSLSKEEYEVIKKHPEWAYKTLNNSVTLKDIAKYILYHHERWDGNGYPKGLKDKEIPLISQILNVADSWNAMRSKRSYRRPLTKKEALIEIKNNKGKQFSPIVVDVFLEIIENKDIDMITE